MDITKFIIEGRDQALSYGDHSTYHSQLSKRILNSRKKLGVATKNRGKFQKRDQVTAEKIAENREYVHLNLLASERAWAHAMSIKTSAAAEQDGLNSRKKGHIISRLHKAAQIADQLVEALSQTATSGASTTDVLELKAYAAMIHGAQKFEAKSWETCLRQYSTARVIYSALSSAPRGDIHKDLLSETIDPSIRYAAYQLKTPRTVSIPAIARKAFPQSDSALVGEVNKINPDTLKQDESATPGAAGADTAPKTLTWRSREVKIEDADIALRWGAVAEAKEKLSEKLDAMDHSHPYEEAGAYDEILAASGDAVDATKTAIDELRAESVGQGDPRMQSLQITRTAVNYEMVSWRIGRNRVLTGEHDGAVEDYESARRGRKRTKAPEESKQNQKELPVGRKLGKLKEKVALYDGTLQNFQTILELPGVAADQELADKLESSVNYFKALSNLSIARSHAIIGNVTNALALINHSLTLTKQAATQLPTSASDPSGPINVDVSAEDITFLTTLLNGELQRHRAIVHIDNIRKEEAANATSTGKPPLVERLHDYPASGVDLDNVVEFPPKMALIPVKPIFLDVAWNYIGYPGKAPAAAEKAKSAAVSDVASEAEKPAAKKGWFGFGRS